MKTIKTKEMKYEKRPEQIEAVQFTGKNIITCFKHCPIARQPDEDVPILVVPTNNGERLVRATDWIVKDYLGDFTVELDADFRRRWKQIKK